MKDPKKPTKLKRLAALAKPQWPMLALGTLFLFIGAGMGLAYPKVIGFIIDEAVKQGSDGGGVALINKAALLMAGIFAIQGIAVGLRYFLYTYAGEKIVAGLRTRLFERILAQEIGFFDSRRTGELTNRLASDTGVIQNAVSVNISMVLRAIANAIGAAVLLVLTSPKLTLLMLMVVPPVALGAAVTGRFVRRFSRRAQDALAKAGEVAEETLSGVRTVRAFAQEPREESRYAEAIANALAFSKRRITYVGLLQALVTFMGFGSLVIVIWYGGRLMVEGQMSVGELTSFVLYTGAIAISLATLAGLWADFMRALGAADRVFELIDRDPTIPLRGGDQKEAIEGRVEFQNVSFAYPSRPEITVLEDLSLTIEPGEKVALVGPSGGGKSTIAALLPRFYDPQSGHIHIDGTPLQDFDPSWLRQRIGAVAQEPTLFSTSVAENIAYGVEGASHDAIVAAAKAANAHDFISGFPEGYETLVGERGVQLSGGQKQRVAIARALLRDPRILVLDEATSALDAESEHLVKEALQRLMQGRTTLIIAHRLATVVDADRVLVIDGGAIVQSGSHAHLAADDEGLYHKLVERQIIDGGGSLGRGASPSQQRSG